MEPLLTTVCAPLFRAIETDAGAPRESCKALAEEVVEVVTPPPLVLTGRVSSVPPVLTGCDGVSRAQVVQGVVGHERFFAAFNACRAAQKESPAPSR